LRLKELARTKAGIAWATIAKHLKVSTSAIKNAV
jgi:hypothetical protein